MHATLALTNLSHYHAETHSAWLEVATSVAALDWPSALTHADKALHSAILFHERAEELADLTELTECLNVTPNGMSVIFFCICIYRLDLVMLILLVL